MRLPHLEKTGRKGEKIYTVIEVLKSLVVLSKSNKYKKASPTIPVRNILDKKYSSRYRRSYKNFL